MPKTIHIKKLWRGAVFALKMAEPGELMVWYHVDYIYGNTIHFSAIHTQKEYTKEMYDRNVWLRN